LEMPEKAIHVDIRQTIETIVQKIESAMQYSFGLIGLGVMGKSLARNLASKGFSLALYNRHVAGQEENVAVDFIQAHGELSKAEGFDELAAFVASLERPRKILIMVNAGTATQAVVDALLEYLEQGDILIDGGNAHYKDTARQQQQLIEKGIHFLGTGVSGGEEGALKGAAIMPGGDLGAYTAVAPFLEAIAAKDQQGKACCGYIGAGGAGHFVKMIHNGIEYAEMQLLAELVDYLRLHQRSWPEIARLLEDWMQGEASSYLLGITVDILRHKDTDGSPLIEAILDKAGNKGTGGWSNIAASTYGMPATMIASALFARYLSAQRDQRLAAASAFDQLRGRQPQGRLIHAESLGAAYQLARLINHQQGLKLIQAASEQHGWQINLSETARIWTNGCIIRSALMEQLVGQLAQGPELLLNLTFQPFVREASSDLRMLCLNLVEGLVPSPCFQAAFQYLAGYTQARSSAYLIQAQRDYFGAHTYKRLDDPEGPA
ncbi:MAG: NADP-dependent phosphogluconate dehydrogenase, partial [Phaeodactylibacter sp.]|nr:NADP-dependent phosphogluconate dehydrogenase [Phaeodactylibacter sp.]